MKALFKIKIYHFLAFLIFLGPNLFAQNQANQVIVYLRDHSFLVGNIIETLHRSYGNIETDDNDLFTKIKTDDGQTITISWKKIKRIKRINPHSIIFKDGKTISTKGFYNVTTLKSLTQTLGLSKFKTSNFQIHSINGFQFNSKLCLGLGLGINSFTYGVAKLNFLPIFADIRGSLMKKMVSPYYAFKTGYGFVLKSTTVDYKTKRSLFVNPEIGLSFASKKFESLQIGISYHYQELKLETEEMPIQNLILSTNILFR